MSRVVLHGGTVITCNAAGQVGEAVCFDEAEGQIIAVGTQAQVQAAAGDGAREVDVEGATVLPGLIDTHPHLMHFGVLAEPLVDLSNAVDHTDIVTRVAAKARDTPPGEWIMTTPVGDAHYFLRRSFRDLAERELPTRHALDRATTWTSRRSPSTSGYATRTGSACACCAAPKPSPTDCHGRRSPTTSSSPRASNRPRRSSTAPMTCCASTA